jgi:hypothetical protein
MATKTVSIEGFINTLTDLEKKEIPFALARALQDAGQIAKKMIQTEINLKVNDPTPFTEKAAFGSSVNKGETSVTFGVKDIQGGYLYSLYEGGQRKLRPFETKFNGKYLTPTVNAKRDSYGNVPLEAVKQILADAKAKANGYYTTKKQIRYRPKGGESIALYNLIDNNRAPTYVPELSLQEPTQAALNAFPSLFTNYLDKGIENSMAKGRYR